MSLYTPPYPARPAVAPGPIAMLRTASRNLLAIWPENTFTMPVFGHRLFNKTLLFVNSPDAVKQAFVDGAATVQQKTMQQRAALSPLVGDGLFISHGETWKQRRKVVAAVTHASRMPQLAEAISGGAWEQVEAWRALPAGAQIDAPRRHGAPDRRHHLHHHLRPQPAPRRAPRRWSRPSASTRP